LIGFLSDLEILDNPNIRILIQSLVCLISVKVLNLEISSIKMPIFDELLKNSYFNILFVTFCLVLIVNGFNFIDGLNTLALAYFFIVFLNLYFLFEYKIFNYNFISNDILIFYILILLIFIFFGRCFLGDSGSYLIGFFISYELLTINRDIPEISPWYIALLLWYPAFETFFSVIRKKIQKQSTFKPDNEHLHQLIYSFINTKIKSFANPFVAIIINLYNLIIFYIGSQNIYNSSINIFLISTNILIYIILYTALKKILQ